MDGSRLWIKPQLVLTAPLVRREFLPPGFSGVGAMPIDPSSEQGVFGPDAVEAMGEPLRLPAKSFTTSASFQWCAKSSPNELLQRHAEASLTRFAYGRPR